MIVVSIRGSIRPFLRGRRENEYFIMKNCIILYQIKPSSESSKLNLVALEIGDGILVDISLLINRFLMFFHIIIVILLHHTK